MSNDCPVFPGLAAVRKELSMLQRKEARKLQLHSETLRHVTEGTAWARDESFSSPGCTVDTTCSPDCCNTLVKK